MALYRPPIRPQPRFSRTNVGPMDDTFKNWSHAGDITDTKAEQDVNTMNIVSFYPQLTFAWQSLPRKTGTLQLSTSLLCHPVARQNLTSGC